MDEAKGELFDDSCCRAIMSVLLSRPRISLRAEALSFRRLFAGIFILLALGLTVLPVVGAFNDGLTRLVLSLRGYRLISEVIVPMEVRWVVVLLRFFGVPAQAAGQYVLVEQVGRDLLVEIIWNCVGWQSLLMFGITAFLGLQRRFSFLSRCKALLLGLTGTVMVNILRIVLIILLFRFFGQSIGLVFHDYGALLTNTGWLFLFWWFAHGFVLEPSRQA